MCVCMTDSDHVVETGQSQGPPCWSCKPTMRIHHACTSYNARDLVQGQDSGPCHCPWPIHPSGDSPTCCLNSKLINRLLSVPWLGQEALLIEDWGGGGGGADRQPTGMCTCVWICIPKLTKCVFNTSNSLYIVHVIMTSGDPIMCYYSYFN